MIHTTADGSTTSRTVSSRDAPSTRTFATRLRSTSRTPWKALKKTTKKTSTEASSTFDAVPNPSQTTKIDPRTIRGIALSTLMNGPITSARNGTWPSSTPSTTPASVP